MRAVRFPRRKAPPSSRSSSANPATSTFWKSRLSLEQAIAGSPLILGNKVTLLQDGPATYAAMFAAIRNARDHINLETYIIEDDEIGQQFADLLLEQQGRGVQVNLIYDSVGGNQDAEGLLRPADGRRDRGARIQSGQPAQGEEAMADQQSRSPETAGGRRADRIHRRDQYQQRLFFGIGRPARPRNAAAQHRCMARYPPSNRRPRGRRIAEAVHGNLGKAARQAACPEGIFSRAEGAGE